MVASVFDAVRRLLAEDDDMLGSSMQKAPQAGRFQVSWVKDGPAVPDAGSGSFDALLLDLGLPGMDRAAGAQVTASAATTCRC